ncbi:MAG: reprolysin-like metallopeptidase, partial [Planctomycetota bacterium]
MRFASKDSGRRHRTATLGMEVLEQRRLLAGLPEVVALAEANSTYEALPEIPVSRVGATSYLAPTSAVPFAIDAQSLQQTLARAPMEFTQAGFANPLEFSIPKPDGTLARFEVVEAPVMHPDLAAKYPQIKTYRGQGLDNPAETIRFDLTPQGFHAQVLSPDGAYYVDPYYHLDDSVYVSYERTDFEVSEVAQELRANYREIGLVEGDILVSDQGSYRLEDDGSLTTIEGGEQFEIYAPGSYVIGDDGQLTVERDDVRETYAADTFHVHNDGTVHVRVSADPEMAGGGCPGCGGMGCGSCAPLDASHAHHVTEQVVALPTESSDEGKGDQGGGDDGGGDDVFGRRTGEELRTYRLANASTVEYTNFHGGTRANGMAAIVTAINRVTGIYEVELTIRLELIANNDQLVFTNATGDSYSNSNGVAMLSQNQAVIDSTIGNANYDVGHVFSTGGGGVAGLGVVGLTGQKARGVTGLGAPIGDPFYVDYVAHEIGHQYGGSHTFNGDSGSCGGQRSGSSAYEPGSGSTIQAYAGICGNDNLQSNSDPYFHFRSLDQMLAHVDNVVPSTGTRTATGNSEPVADAGPNYEIPAGTPFMLTGSGTDVDGDTLTYNWEQRDLGPQSDLNAADQGSIPLFRSRLATLSPTRFFPREQNLIANNYNQGGEKLPTEERRMDFRLTVRDNASGGGGIDTDNMWVDINDTGAPFRVTSQNSGGVWLGGATETITWDVAGTTASPINTLNVDIYISDDGGFTYDIPLALNIPNDGSHIFSVPTDLEISDARLMVKGAGNIFFDINDQNFSIIGVDTTPPTAVANTNDINGAGFSSLFFSVTYTDNQAVDASDIGQGDVEIVAPDNSILTANYISQTSNDDVPVITGNYR